MPNTAPRPIAVKTAIFIFGILAFQSWFDVNTKNSESLEILLPLVLAIPINIAFIGLISDAKIGRVLAVIISALLGILGLSYWLMLLFSNETTYFQLVATTILLFIFLGWLAVYSFGKTARAYYSGVIKNKIEQHR